MGELFSFFFFAFYTRCSYRLHCNAQQLLVLNVEEVSIGSPAYAYTFQCLCTAALYRSKVKVVMRCCDLLWLRDG